MDVIYYSELQIYTLFKFKECSLEIKCLFHSSNKIDVFRKIIFESKKEQKFVQI